MIAAIAALAILAGPLLGAGAETARQVKPLPEIMAIVTERYRGDITAAEVLPGKPDEEAALVYELRMLTPAGNVLRIRVDAYSGAFLEIDGRGLVEARKPPAQAR